MHNNNNSISMQNVEQGRDLWCWFNTTQFTYKGVFNPNVTTVLLNCMRVFTLVLFIIVVLTQFVSTKPLYIRAVATGTVGPVVFTGPLSEELSHVFT